MYKNGAPERIRTFNLRLRRPPLYPVELRAHIIENSTYFFLLLLLIINIFLPIFNTRTLLKRLDRREYEYFSLSSVTMDMRSTTRDNKSGEEVKGGRGEGEAVFHYLRLPTHSSRHLQRRLSMTGNSLRLFSLLGFEVKVDLSWLIILFLIIWSLGQGLFPMYFEGLPSTTYWVMGVFGALGLFFSITVHEFSHSLVARRFGMPIKGITLFIFGGVAEMESEPPSARSEFFMAIAGPIASVVMGVIFYLLFLGGSAAGIFPGVLGVFWYMGIINFILAGFNMIPAFPLDGGRVLRSALWSWKKNLQWATRIASYFGTGFGIFLVAVGVLNFLQGNLLTGVWLFLIGLFIQNASQASFQRVLLMKTLHGEKVRRFMKEDPTTVPPGLSIKNFMEDYVYRYHHKMFPVVDDEVNLHGCLTTRALKSVPREEWENRTVGELTNACSFNNTISPEEDAMTALSRMNKEGNSRLLVVEGDKLIGIITLKDLMKFFSMKMELEGEPPSDEEKEG